MSRPEDLRWLDAAAALAARGRPLSRPNPAVGAVIVKDGKVVGRGWTQAGGRPHAEAEALAMAGEAANGATLYVTLEPCAHASARGPSCTSLVLESGLARAVIGVEDPDPRTAGSGIAALRKAGIEAEIRCKGFAGRISEPRDTGTALHNAEACHIARWPDRASRWQQQMDHRPRGAGALSCRAGAGRRDPGRRRNLSRRCAKA